MGITNLLQFVKDAGAPIKVSELKKSTVAVDAYGWLHKGIFSCADKLARGEHSDLYVNYCMKYINMLLAHKIKVIMVFDGRHLPAKEATEEDRRKKRDSHKAKAAELLILDRGSEAQSHLRQSVDVTHKMALNVIQACRARGVDCIVAPFEADAQMAYLNIAGYADYVITEDSDLLVFGAKKIIYKLDLSGNCCFMDREKLPSALKMPLAKFTDAKFRYMCILSGCDYWTGIKGMGLKKAKDYALRKINVYGKIGSYVKITKEFLTSFHNTNLMFLYQSVYDPVSKEVVPLNPLEPEMRDEVFSQLSLKELELPKDQAFQLALGNLDPFSLEEMDQWNPDSEENLPVTSIWSKQYEKPCDRAPSCEESVSEPPVFQKLKPVASSPLKERAASRSISSQISVERNINGAQSPQNGFRSPEKMAGKRKIDETDTSPPAEDQLSPPPVKTRPNLSQYAFGGSSKSQNPFARNPRSQNPFAKTPLSQNPPVKALHSQNTSAKNNLPQNPSTQTSHQSENPPAETIRSQNPFAKSPLSQNLSAQTSLQSENPPAETIRSQNPFAKTPLSQNLSAKTPRSQNPFAKTPDAAKSPDLSDGSLKSGLKQILDQGGQRKVATRIISPFFARFTVEKAPKTTPTSQTAGNTSTSQSVQGTNPDAKSSKEETSPKVPAINAFAKMMERQVVCS
ncbi:hypothetical protein M8J75_015896 [Diaphorina citri]|nr:hypothetical protein M8J75_015896 [Diaphorina citri]